MSQKRDLELAESARKIVLKPRKTQNNYDQITRSKSNDDAFRLIKVKLESEPKQTCEVQKRTIKTRTSLLNVIDILLSEYTNDEARFLKQPIALLNCYFSSTQFREKRKRKQIKDLKNGFKL